MEASYEICTDSVNKQSDSALKETDEVTKDVRICVIFGKLLCFALAISFIASCLIGLQYSSIAVANTSAERASDPYNQASAGQLSYVSLFLCLLAFYCWFKVYLFFLMFYHDFILNDELVKIYNMSNILDTSTCTSFFGSFCAWFIILVIWIVYFCIDTVDYIDDHESDTDIDTEITDWMNSKLAPLTSDISSPYYWSVGLLMSPVWILCLLYIFVAFATHRAMKKRIEIGLNENLLSVNGANDFSLNRNWRVNKKLLGKVVLVHLLLLVTWVIWKWLTTPFVAVSASSDVTVSRNNPLLSYWLLYGLTVIIKYICIFVSDTKKVEMEDEILLFKSGRLQMMINILTTILFSFGLKFVFTNIESWDKFIIISALNAVLSIFVNGSFQSHQYGKKFVNKIKRFINEKCCCGGSKRLGITDFNDIKQVLDYNSNLGFSLSMNFVVSSCSCLIMMAYFAMLMAGFGSKIDVKVFEFLAASFGIDCVIIFGQLCAFKKRDRGYFLHSIFVEKPSATEKKETSIGWTGVLALSLFLAWFWIGSITGGATDIST